MLSQFRYCERRVRQRLNERNNLLISLFRDMQKVRRLARVELASEKPTKELGTIHFEVRSNIGKDGAQSPDLKLLVGRNCDVVLGGVLI